MTDRKNQVHAADQILSYYDACLAYHGDTALGAGWPNEPARQTRFAVMLGVQRGTTGETSLCDLGCGTGELLTYLKQSGQGQPAYTGIDRSNEALELARLKHPDAPFLNIDLLDTALDMQALQFDYVIANGLFTVKANVTVAEMHSFWTAMVERMWGIARQGIAFNVMSKIVDWERADLFHVSLDDTAALLHRLAGRNVVLRADYGLYEYTAYAYRDPRRSTCGTPPPRRS
jgi:SAM-dependent methyltransferase